jgi:hypothetical protein
VASIELLRMVVIGAGVAGKLLALVALKKGAARLCSVSELFVVVELLGRADEIVGGARQVRLRNVGQQSPGHIGDAIVRDAIAGETAAQVGRHALRRRHARQPARRIADRHCELAAPQLIGRHRESPG